MISQRFWEDLHARISQSPSPIIPMLQVDCRDLAIVRAI